MVDRAGRVVVVAVAVAIGFAGCTSGEGQPVTVLRGKTTAVNDVRTAKPAPQPIEMGVVEAAAHEDGGGGRGVVVWLKCL